MWLWAQKQVVVKKDEDCAVECRIGDDDDGGCLAKGCKGCEGECGV